MPEMPISDQHLPLVAVIGAGTSGCAAARQLVLGGLCRVVLIEAGPDYGPFDAHLWPSELLDTRSIPETHDAGLFNDDGDGRRYRLERARVIGGCSAHNGCSAVRGTRHDFERWRRETAGAWDASTVERDYRDIEALLRVRPVDAAELSPYQRAVRDAALGLGVPPSRDINDLEEDEGVSLCPVNKRGAVRWNAAFAFVDDLRSNPRLEVIDRTDIHALHIESGVVRSVRGLRSGHSFDLDVDAVVIACGAYGTPVLLQRSGVGDPSVLGAAGVPLSVASPGVGRNLQDHPCMVLSFTGTPELAVLTRDHACERLLFEEGVIVKLRSSLAQESFDLHVFPVGGRSPSGQGDWYWLMYVGVMLERSRGSVLLDAGSKGSAFTISHRHFSDPNGEDMQMMLDGIAHARAIATQAPLRSLIGQERSPGACPALSLRQWVAENHVHYWHPAGTARMGTDVNAGHVCDASGAVFGLSNAHVADTSAMPFITGANTNLPAALLGWRTGRAVSSRITRRG
jgi:choline dehydrogenase